MTDWYVYLSRQKNGNLKVGVTRDIFSKLIKPSSLVWHKKTSSRHEAVIEKARLTLLSGEEKEAILPWYTPDPNFRKTNVLLDYYLRVTPPPINGMTKDDYRKWLSSFHDSVRGPLVRKYSWGIPTEEAIRTITNCGPIVEMGAGTGYWADLIQMLGGDIIAYDENPPSEELSLENWNIWHSNTSFFDVKAMGPIILSQHENRALLLCWPPADSPMAEECLKRWKGKTLIFVGDRRVTANKAFFRLLDKHFTVSRVVAIPQWADVDDRMIILERIV